MPPDPADLNYSTEQMRDMACEVLERCLSHLASLPQQPARGDVDAADQCRGLREPAPRGARPLRDLLDKLFEQWIPRSFTTAGPGYMAYVPGGGLFATTLAEMIANTTNRFVGVWQAAPLLAELEANVLDWIRDWMQFPATTRGLLTSGGSMSTWTAIVTAREWLLGADIRSGVIYASEEVHHCLHKSARLAGIMPDRIRTVPVDADYRMRVDELAPLVEQDRRDGLRPFLLVSSAGTINTGAVDPLAAIAEACDELGMWHHVDGAYGGFFHLVPELRPLLAGLRRADSIALDPHKGLFLPYGTGALLVRDGERLKAAHAAYADYLPTAAAEEFYDMSMYGPELSRPFRGLRVWLPVQLYGVDKLRAAIREKRELAVRAHDRLAEIDGLRIVAPPQLSLFAYHLTWPGASLDQENRATRELLERVIRRGDVMLSGCTVKGRFLGRLCVLSFRTRRAHVETCVAQLAEEAERLIAERRA